MRLTEIAKRRARLDEEDAALEYSAGEYCKTWKRLPASKGLVKSRKKTWTTFLVPEELEEGTKALDESTQITWGEDDVVSVDCAHVTACVDAKYADTSSDKEEWEEVNKGGFENIVFAKAIHQGGAPAIPLSISLSPIIPLTSISIPPSIRMPLKLEQAAMKALHLPSFQKQFISRETFLFDHPDLASRIPPQWSLLTFRIRRGLTDRTLLGSPPLILALILLPPLAQVR
jgi:hypothetical protein